MAERQQTAIEWLQEFYFSHCDGSWEHGTGFTISTLDNPGWSVTFDLETTSLEDKEFRPVTIERSENDWVHCRVEGNIFQGAGGPKNLIELLTIFRQWAGAT